MGFRAQEELELIDLELKAIDQQLGQAQQAPAQISPQDELAQIDAELAQIDQQMQAPQIQEPTPEQKAEAGLMGFAETATLGFLPQIQAGVETAVEAISDPTEQINEELREQGFNIKEIPSKFVDKRDKAIKNIKRLERIAPTAFITGQVAGAISTPALGAAKVAKAASFTKKALAAGLSGGVTGFVQNPGDTEGIVDPLQLKERVQNAAVGTLAGAAGQGIFSGAGKLFNTFVKSPRTLKKFAGQRALKAAGFIQSDLKKLRRISGRDMRLGDFLLEKNIVEVGDTIEAIAKKAETLKQNSGSIIGRVYGDATNKLQDQAFLNSLSPAKRRLVDETKINAVEIAAKLKEKFASKFKGKAGGTEIINSINKRMDELAQNGTDVNLQQIKEVRSSFDGLINWSKRQGDLPDLQRAYTEIRNELKNTAEKRIKALDGVLGRDDLKLLKTANADYNLLAEAARVATDRVAQLNGNRFFSLGDRINAASLGSITASAGGRDGVALGLFNMVAGAIASRAGRKFGAAAAADAASRLSQKLQSPANLAKFGQPIIDAATQNPEKLGTIIQQLRLDPDFNKIVEESINKRR